MIGGLSDDTYCVDQAGDAVKGLVGGGFDTVRMDRRLIRSALAVLPLIVVTVSPESAPAGGICMLHPEPFKLRSDTVHWSIKIKPGGECIQGLQWSTLIVKDIAVAERPRFGKLVLAGPSFRYLSEQGAGGSDSFKLSVSGTSLRVDGTSTIEVDVIVK